MGGLITRCKDACSDKSNGYEMVLDSEWAQAVRSGNVEQMRSLLSQDKELIDTAVDKNGKKALHLSINKSYYEMAFELLSKGANVNEKCGRDEDTPLHEACKLNDVESITILLRFGANANITNRQRKPPMDLCNEKTKREFTKERIAQLQSLGRPKLYSDIKINVQSSTTKNNSSKKKAKDNSKDSDSDRGSGAMEISHSHSLSASYNSIWSESDTNVQLSIGQKVDWNSNAFSQQFGVELTDVLRFLKSPKSKSIMETIWERITKDPNQTKVHNNDEQLYKLTYAAIFAAAKTKDRSIKTISKESVKQVAKKIKKELVQQFSNSNSNASSYEYELTKQQFVSQFGDLLESIHQTITSP